MRWDLRGLGAGTIRVVWLSPGDHWDPASLDEADIVLAMDPDGLDGPAAVDALRRAIHGWLAARRVGIRIGASNWPNAPRWGDFHFARALQRALQEAGHPTRIRLLRDWDSPAAARDDVTIHLFGKVGARNRPSQINVLWQISHPDLASAALYRSYDLVEPLLQATDPDRFRPGPGGPAHDLLYVANHRADRPVVTWLLPTDLDLAVYGQGWEAEPAVTPYWRGGPIPNEELGRAYAAAAIVLNDSWADMRDQGFIPNRVFDALAAGGFVLSDSIAGLADTFEGAVPTYHDAASLRAAIDGFLADPDARTAHATRGQRIVLSDHTFTRRVATILAAIDDLARRP